MDEQKPFPMRAAEASFIAGLAAWIVPVSLRGNTAALPPDDARMYVLIIGLLSVLVMIIGAALAIVALRGVRQYGRNGIAVPAMLGLLINGAGIALFVVGFISASRSA